MAVQISTHRFTVQEFHKMGEAGIFTEDDRVELLDGEIIEMTPIGSRHASVVDRLAKVFNQRLGQEPIVRVQNPILLDEHSEPQPDVTILRPKPDFYAQEHPKAGDVLLLVEISDTTLEFDREIKLPLYAKAGIREVWIVDLANRAIEVYRQPSAAGYRQTHQACGSNRLSPEAFSDVTITPNEIFP